MCRAVTCKVCGKTTWAGCGQHIEAVKASVPASDWCPGHDPSELPPRRSMWSRLSGK